MASKMRRPLALIEVFTVTIHEYNINTIPYNALPKLNKI